ncbi:asparagine synthase (glutamine-hydrolyzing) [Aliarcobacter cryaerophilus]|uniref:asparagine synthase (glutamine-hydrolyzing) n=1 Tax=Aliarcobacter cryaerophilus TaxID=28198 RepID=UPI000EAF6456|nr:asparagine synthase (glutamine-hydrolyzing) [Aliarcobacter cryaerophilus]AYJ78402.1 asparagine synthase (glutamine-hydrolyzing, glutamine amidotransferase class-II domain) [Aliarcobacter cryaerophilus D2610]
MCGIVGIISQKPNKIAKNIFLANNQMYRRGPDDEGFLLVNERNIDICYGEDTPLSSFKDNQAYYPTKNIKSTFEEFYNIAFGHRRLSIVDLSSHGHQPMCDESKRYWIVFNGEVYNFNEIKEELLNLGYLFVSNTDTEVILKSYIQWGENCLQKFNGDFAFAIYDNDREEVFLARDRLGIKPLYYTVQNDNFIFASDIKTLIASKLYVPKVNMEGLYHNFSFSVTPRPQTSFKDVYALKQGHYLKIDSKTLKFQEIEYWDIPTGIQNLSMTEDEAKEIVEEELKKSIKYRLNSDVEIASFMSGGVDSTIISAIASKYYPNIKAFTLGFNNFSKYDEVNEAKATAKMHDINHIITNIEADDVLKYIDKMVLGFEEPYYGITPHLIAASIVREHDIKVTFNGLGGDELFAGYSIYSRYNKLNILSKINPLFKIVPSFGKIKTLKNLTDFNNMYEYFANNYSIYLDQEKKDLFDITFNSKKKIQEQYFKKDKKFSDDLELLSYLDFKVSIGNHYTYRTEQFNMYYSLEARFPFLDHNLIEKVFTIPSKYKLKNGIGKYILKEVAKNYIAPECLSMNKKGFSLPLEYWFDNQLKDLVNSSIQALKNRNFFNKKGIDNILKIGTISQKWQLVMCELWFQQFIDSK